MKVGDKVIINPNIPDGTWSMHGYGFHHSSMLKPGIFTINREYGPRGFYIGVDEYVYDEEWAGFLFREATDIERNIASATEVNLDEFMEGIMHFNPDDTLIGIYREGAYAMLRHIRANLTING